MLRYLLYLDILGFSDLVKSNYQKVVRLFNVIDSLNAHAHGDFKSVVFSDTLLIFNQKPAESKYDNEYIIMYLCEFAQDLLFRSIELDIQFRAIITHGEFNYEKLKNIEAYHGKALISAYQKEKNLATLGLYIDKNINHYNTIFATEPFDENLEFVFLLQQMESLKRLGLDEFPLPWELADPHLLYDFKDEVSILKSLKENITSQKDSRVRAKYLQAYHFYHMRYKRMIDYLEKNSFDYRSASPDWK